MQGRLPTYCINLKRRKDRRIFMGDVFSKHRDILNVHFVTAIDGRELAHHPHALGTKNKYACLRSHLKALERIKFDGHYMAFVCEDDIVFCDDLSDRFKHLINDVPNDWDMIYFGYFDAEFSRFPKNITKNVCLLDETQLGAFAYMVNGKSIDRIISHLNKETNFTDNALAELRREPNFKAYCFDPFLCYVEEGYSDTSESHVNYDSNIKVHFQNKIDVL